MRDAVIVSTARTGIGRAFRGSLNATRSPSLAGHALAHAVARAGVDPAEVEDVILGTVLAAGTAGSNIARHAAFAAGIAVTAGAMTVDRQCASGLMAIATAARQVILDGQDVVAAGGQENISAVQEAYFRWTAEPKLTRPSPTVLPHAYMPMLQDRRTWSPPAMASAARCAGRLCGGKPAPHRRSAGRRPL